MSDNYKFADWKARALLNPKGKIVSSGAIGNDRDNVGRWDGRDAYRDFYTDIFEAALRLTGNPEYLIGDVATLKPLQAIDQQYDRPPWLQLVPIFWFSADKFIRMADFIKVDETAEDGLLILTGSDGSAVLIDTR
jgi:predicted chitinase